MTKENKDLLLKDLCGRLSYGIKVKVKHCDNVWKLLAIYTNGTTYATGDTVYPVETYFEDCKPYLFPLSSMTKEQQLECSFAMHLDMSWLDINLEIDQFTMITYHAIDFFNRNHLDYRGLIEKGLAIDATGLNLY